MNSSVHIDEEDDGIPAKILVVDDLKENHRVFNNILSEVDARIYSASSGEDAISLSLRHQFAVILLDVMMPGIDGFETANILRINEDTKFTPIIFVTAMEPNEEYECQGYDVGAVDYLFKPIKPQALTGKVKVFIELERQRYKIKKTLEDIQRLENRNDLLLKSVGEGILGVDQTGSISFSNPAAHQMLGFSEDELDNTSIMDIICLSNTESYNVKWEDSEVFNRCVTGLGHHESIGVFWNKNKNLFPVEYLATPIRDRESDDFVGVVIAFQDVTERKKTEDQLARLAQIDTLTGLYNRYSFSKQLMQSVARSVRQNTPLALLFIDLDKFKQINDSYGHCHGDILLKACAERLQNCVRDGDVLSRIGGDEFTAILESINNGVDAAVVARKIIAELSKPFEILGCQVFVSASIGISTFPESSSDADTLLRCADIAMYKAKESGRNSYQFFTDAMQVEVASELSLENSLRKAVENNEFQLYYQPKLDAQLGTVIGMEALLRWRDENGNFISPERFIPKAEEMGLIYKIGRWVLDEGCQQMKAWQDAGFFTVKEKIAINLSVRQLMSENLPAIVDQVLKDSHLPPPCLELEVTESMMMEDIKATVETFNDIHKLGVHISIDDFGTGYSSLSYLRELPIDCLKIDKSFVQALGEENGNAIVKAIIALAKNLDLSIVAEGVETEDQVEFLSEHGVDIIQGYYYSAALNSVDFIEFLKSHRSIN